MCAALGFGEIGREAPLIQLEWGRSANDRLIDGRIADGAAAGSLGIAPAC